MARHKKTQFQIDKRNRFLIGIWAGLFAGLIIGIIAGAALTCRNIAVKDIQGIKAEIRITVEEMKLEQIEMDKLTKMIRGWQMEIDEIWLYYGTNQPIRTRAMSSEEGRPSIKD